MPDPVVAAITGHLEREAQIGGYESAEEAAAEVGHAYEAVAALLGTQARNVALVENATVGFAQALSAFDLRPGDEIVTSRNDYISNQLAYLSLARRVGAVIRRADDLPEGGVDPDSVRELLRSPRARLLAITWVPTNSGLIQPVEALGGLAEEAGVPYLVDACQAAGQLPIDVARLRCDFLSATARKFLRGPRGIGFLYVSERALARGDFPLHLDMRGGQWLAPDSFALAPDARRFENWEFAYALVLGLGAAARYAAGVGIDIAGARARALAARLRTALTGLPGVRVLDHGRELAAIVTAEVAGWPAPQLVAALRARGINTSAAARDTAVIDMDAKRAATALRLSPSYYNTAAEVDAAVDALRSISG
ncbi:MAG: aminotransferase class V-fold PLP-dependent enzyme [Proteobacteria bacterium]|nr:aminotransferase class V-fold PLP-dependent enzyme [Pseudomonadota bacterium]